MKNLKKNKGFTLIELLVSIAILSFIILAVGGIMFSNNLIYRKEKADITVAGSAQDVYNKINEDIMQAKHVYIEGYVSNTKVDFATNKIKDNSVTVVEKKFLIPTDQYILDNASGDPASLVSPLRERSVTSREAKLSTMSTADQTFYRNLLGITDSKIDDELQKCTDEQVETYKELKYYSISESDAIANTLSDDEKELYYAFSNRFKYYSSSECDEEVTFLKKVPTKTNSDFGTLSKAETDGTMTYTHLYITKLVLVYTQKVDTAFITDPSKFNADKSKPEYLDEHGNQVDYPQDVVTVEYTFGGVKTENQIRCKYKYKYMDKLDTDLDKYPDGEIITKQLNYAKANGTTIPGCEAEIDAEKDSIKLYLYFADKSMTYTDRGMVKVRNSYVLHDAK